MRVVMRDELSTSINGKANFLLHPRVTGTMPFAPPKLNHDPKSGKCDANQHEAILSIINWQSRT